MRIRRSVGIASALVGVAAVLGGCSGAAPTPDPLLASPSLPASALPTGSAAPSASASVTTTILPGSALAEVEPYTYSAIPGSKNAVPPEIEQLATYFEGYVGRQIERDGKVRGTVQLLRTKAGVLGDDASGDRVLEEFLKGFSGATTFDRSDVEGTQVLVAKAPGSAASVAGWRAGQGGRDLILVLTAPSLPPKDFARAYIGA